MPRSLLSIPLLLTLALLTVATTYGSANSQAAANGEYDADGDGLIEVEFLEQLDAIRYDLDGDGKADDDSGIEAYAAAFPGTVCNDNCNGYELARPLDFAAADSYASGTVSAEWTTGEGWLPIQSGEVWILFAENPFAATFDGNGHTISNLYVNRPDNPEDSAPAGLFGSASDSIIRNVGLVDVHAAGFVAVGGLVGANLGAIRDSYVTGRVAGFGYVGGLAGFTDYSSKISGSHFTGAVTAGETDGEAVGGLVGYQDGVISDSYATGSVLGDKYVGGLAGENRGYVVASYSSADVTGNTGVGGLAGVNRLLISGSYATGSVTGGSAVGGLAGYNGAQIIASYATGVVTGDEGVGGLAGENYTHLGDITASYATGQVSGNENVGGLVGQNTDEAGITASYATGRISGGDNVGGLIGLNAANVTGAAWDTETSGIGNGVGRGDPEGVTGQTTVELQAAAGYSGVYRDWELYLGEGIYRDYAGGPGPYDFWDFGTSGQYPALKAYLGFPGFTDWWESGGQPRDARPSALPPAPGMAVSPALAVRYDSDGDGLIEVSNLEQLDAIRYDLDGNGIPEGAAKDEYAAAYPVSGEEVVCNNNCKGYELARPLDFAAADSYASGAASAEWTAGEGWRPIGDSWHSFAATFNGNGHAVSNLYITPTTQADSSSVDGFGLFGSVGVSGVIRETGLLNVSVTGGDFVGPLVGANQGTVSHSYAAGRVSGYGCVGGLVGSNDFGVIIASYATGSVLGGFKYLGGLAGCNNGGTIIASYATGSVSGDTRVGGLVGDNSGSVTASYATGSVRGQEYVGGLVGNNDDGQISASYSVSEVTGGHYIGGLAGGNGGIVGYSYAVGKVSSDGSIDAPLRYIGGLVGYNPGIIVSGLWDTETSGQQVGIGIEIGDGQSSDIFGKTTAELQSPAGYTGPYQGWDVSLFIEGAENTADYSLSDFWDFGTSGQYPALKVDFDGNGAATWQEFGNQRRDAPDPTPAPVVDNCVEIMTTAVVSGAWSSNCASGRRPGSYARFYTFTLAEPSEVIIDLESGDTDTYLYLLQGAGRTGPALGSQGSSSRSSRIEHTLGAGTYTVEVTTYGGAQAGSFTLTVNGSATPPPPPLHTPASIPTATPLPTPTPAPVEPTNTPAPTPIFVTMSTSALVKPTNTPAPTATAIAAQEPTPAPDSGGACGYPDGETQTGAAAISMFLLAAPLAMIGGLKFRARRRRGR